MKRSCAFADTEFSSLTYQSTWSTVNILVNYYEYSLRLTPTRRVAKLIS